MNKRFGDLIAKILSGEKKIESRWSKNKTTPWNKVHAGDVVYFKNAGEPVTARADVGQVKQFRNLNPERAKEILNKWGGKDGIDVTSYDRTLEWARNKRYCTLIFLKNPQKVAPFRIDKRGFGSAAAWLCTSDIKVLC